MNDIEINLRPITLKNSGLRRWIFLNILERFVDWKQLKELVSGYELVDGDLEQLEGKNIFYNAAEALDTTLPLTAGERALQCDKCEAKKMGHRPFLATKSEGIHGAGVLCIGLMATQRPSEELLSCLQLIDENSQINLHIQE